MIAYFDTSSVIPLLVDEVASERCERLWDEAARAVSSRLLYPEARAALAQAARTGRLSRAEHRAAVAELDALVAEFDVVELTAEVAYSAGELAEQHALRGYDAVHLAAALTLAEDDLVFVTGDVQLVAAARGAGLAVAATTTA